MNEPPLAKPTRTHTDFLITGFTCFLDLFFLPLRTTSLFSSPPQPPHSAFNGHFSEPDTDYIRTDEHAEFFSAAPSHAQIRIKTVLIVERLCQWQSLLLSWGPFQKEGYVQTLSMLNLNTEK